MAIVSHVWRLSPPLKSVLERVSEAIGKPVVILSDNHQGDYDWVNFRVLGLVDEGASPCNRTARRSSASKRRTTST